MDKNFMDKFNFIFGVIQTCMLMVGITIMLIFIAHFSYSLGVIESKISVLEEQNPITIKGDNHG